jgi:hypothetical protein
MKWLTKMWRNSRCYFMSRSFDKLHSAASSSQNRNETNGTACNELAQRSFDEGAITPEDDWTSNYTNHALVYFAKNTS